MVSTMKPATRPSLVTTPALSGSRKFLLRMLLPVSIASWFIFRGSHMVVPGMAGQSRVEFLQAQALAAAPSVAHGIAIKRYSSARGRRDLRTEALVSSDESGDSDAGSMVAQFSNAVQAVKPALPAPPPGMDPLLFISSSKVLSFMAASC